LETGWTEIRALLGAELLRSVNGGAFDQSEPRRSFNGWEFVLADGAMRLAGGQHQVELYLIRVGTRAERVAVVSRDFRESSGLMVSTSRALVWNRAVRGFLASLRFDGVTATPVEPAGLKPGPIVGVWKGIAMSFGSLKTHHAIFFDNGTAYFGPSFPTSGLAGIDAAAEQLAAARYWGRWTMSGGQGVLTMPYGTVPLRLDPSALVMTTNRTPHRFIRLNPLPERLDGTWCLPGGACLTFTAAGTFVDRGAGRRLEHGTYPFPETPLSGEGNYRIVDHTLVLQYRGGPEVRLAAPGSIDPIRGSPASLTLSFNEDVLQRSR
jgi:hypothetical protein